MIKFGTLYKILSSPKRRVIHVVLEKRRRKFINNYGELPKYVNGADGDPWDVIVPGYPKLAVGEPLRFKELLGVYALPNDNHKLIVDVYTDMERVTPVEKDVLKFQKKYEEHTKLKGTVIYF